jgi:hypothetical protein
VGYVPTGSGLMVMANRDVRVFNNEFDGNGTGSVIIRGFMKYGDREMVDPNYYPYPQDLYIHDNHYGRGGYKPMGVRGKLYAEAAMNDGKLPDITWDGIKDDARIKSGELPPNHNIFIKEDGASYVCLDLPGYMKDPNHSKIGRDIAVHAGSLPPLDPVKLPQDDS